MFFKKSKDWAHTFEVPKRFSFKTMEAITTGIITKNARIEIINAMHTRMLQYVDYPTPEQYKIVCWKLVQKYTTLQDKIGTGIVSIEH